MGSDIQAEREAFSLLKFLVSRPLLKKEVDAALADAGPVSDAVRDRARQLLVHVSDEPMRFNNAAWEAARQPGLDPGRYRSALRLAQTACDMAPDNGMCLNTLGVLQFRVGDDAEAVKTLTRSEKLNAQRLGLFTVVPDPSDTAFLAMAHYRLGRAEEARKYLEQTRKAVKLPPWNANPEAVRFLREADALIQPPPKS
jgi:tetratricopeptide (TPR) repeat protein